MVAADYEDLELALAHAEESLVPASKADRKMVLGKMLLVLQLPALDELHEEIRWNAYHDALAVLPLDVLRVACATVLKTEVFFPKPAEILIAASAAMQARRMLLNRLKAIKAFRVIVAGQEEVRMDPSRRKAMADELRKLTLNLSGESAS